MILAAVACAAALCGSATSAASPDPALLQAGAQVRAVAGRAARAGTQLDLATSAGREATAVRIRRRDWQLVEPLPTVAHKKEAGSGYLPGSPLHKEQERRAVQVQVATPEERRAVQVKEAMKDRGEDVQPITVQPVGGNGAWRAAQEEREAAGAKGAEGEEAKGAEGAEEAKGAEGSEEAKGAEGAEGSETGRAVAVLMLSGIVIGSVLFAMTQTAVPHVADATVLVVDRVTAIFLAVLWFSAFDDILHQLVPSDHHWWILAIKCVVLLCAAAMLAWSLRQRSFGLAAFCAVGAHFSAFMGHHWALNVQKNHFVLSPIHTAFGFLVVALLFFLVCAILYIIKKTVLHIKVGSKSRDESVNEFMDRFDDMENDFVAMSLAAYWVMVVRFIVTQHYPREGELEPGEVPPHTGTERSWLLMFSIALLVIGLVACHFLSKVTINGYVPNRCADIFKAFMVNSWVFAFIFWAEMEFFEHPSFSVQPILTRIVFASVVSVAAAVCILVCAPGSASAGTRMVLLNSSALAAGIAWEEVFDASLESFFEPYEDVHWLKGAVVLGISAFVLPIYVIYFKPYSLKAEDDK